MNFFILFSREGVTQGDPLSMFCYAIGTLPLIRQLKKHRPEPHQSWYADNASAIGKFEDLHLLFKDLATFGSSYGYLPNSSKSILVVPEDRVERAKHYFNDVHGYNFSIQTGARYLGGFIGSDNLRDEYVSSKVTDWVYGVEKLAMVATKNQSHAAYTGFTKSFQHEWTYFQRTIGGIAHLFSDLEASIRTKFLPALQDEPEVDDTLRSLLGLRVKSSGAGIPDPASTCSGNFEQSQVSCSMLIPGIQGKSTFLLADHEKLMRATRNAHVSRRNAEHDSQLSTLLKSLPDDENGKNYRRRIILRGGDTGIWLSTVPNSSNGNILGDQEFTDAF